MWPHWQAMRHRAAMCLLCHMLYKPRHSNSQHGPSRSSLSCSFKIFTSSACVSHVFRQSFINPFLIITIILPSTGILKCMKPRSACWECCCIIWTGLRPTSAVWSLLPPTGKKTWTRPCSAGHLLCFLPILTSVCCYVVGLQLL